MNLQELINKLRELIQEDYANKNKIKTNNLLLYIQEIKKKEPNEYLSDILENRNKEKNIYIDFSLTDDYKDYDYVFFSNWSKCEGNEISVSFITLSNEIIVKPHINQLYLEEDKFEEIEDFIDNEWPLKYILFDEKLFNQFINPYETEFLNWKLSPWEMKS